MKVTQISYIIPAQIWYNSDTMIFVYVSEILDDFMPHTALLHGARRAELALYTSKAAQNERATASLLLSYALKAANAPVPLPPETVRCGNGKPSLAVPCGLHFSMAHTNGYALCTLHTENVGADIELISDKICKTAAKLLRSAAEKNHYSSLPEQNRAAYLTRLWTKRESLGKLTGKGVLHALSLPLSGKGRIGYTVTRTVKGCAVSVSSEKRDSVKIVWVSKNQLTRIQHNDLTT